MAPLYYIHRGNAQYWIMDPKLWMATSSLLRLYSHSEDDMRMQELR